jgi:hypothetical protein
MCCSLEKGITHLQLGVSNTEGFSPSNLLLIIKQYYMKLKEQSNWTWGQILLYGIICSISQTIMCLIFLS